MIQRLLVANRGEIAIRIARAAAELNIISVAVASGDDTDSRHVAAADQFVPLTGVGARAYLDADALVSSAVEAGCDAVHPGYGFLSESADFAIRCRDAGLTFVGPTPEHLSLFGDKAAARALALGQDVPVLRGSIEPVTLEQAEDFRRGLGAHASLMLKALAGGGGRGIRLVGPGDDIAAAYERCRSEAAASFGDPRVFVEEALPAAQHIEVQIVGDGAGGVRTLGERDCTIQRRNQKLIEIAPSPNLPDPTRERILAAAARLAEGVKYAGVGTFEFLLDVSAGAERPFYFLEVNPRLQVEHTITEEVTGVDLVQAQLLLAGGASLDDAVGSDPPPSRRAFAVQARVNMETMAPDGTVLPTGGMLHRFELPSGPGVRVDTFGYVGYRPSLSFDSLLAKVVVSSSVPSFQAAAAKTARALDEFDIEGIATNLGFLRALLRHPSVTAGEITTRFVEEHLDELLEAIRPGPGDDLRPGPQAYAGARLDTIDPLAVLHYGSTSEPSDESPADLPQQHGVAYVEAPIGGTIVNVDVAVGSVVIAGQQIVVMEAMKMEHVISTGESGTVTSVGVAPGDAIQAGHVLVAIEVDELAEAVEIEAASDDLEEIRGDLGEVFERRRGLEDAARPSAVERRRAQRRRTARENVAALVDPGSFREYRPLIVAAQRHRRSTDELISKTPADGVITGVGRINGELFGAHASDCSVVAFDETVLAGTLGIMGHQKLNRCFEVVAQSPRPIVLFAEGGGGRAGDFDINTVVHVDVRAYYLLARVSGLVPIVGIVAGRCFAAHAGLTGVVDVIIATRDANIGMGGPAMIEGGGLGAYRPEEIGPTSVQTRNGVIDVLVEDEVEAVDVAKKYLGYFQGVLPSWSCADQREARFLVPENRLRAYDVRKVIDVMADTGSVLEIRRLFAPGMVTSFIRVEGRPLGVIANNPVHLGGAIDSDGADKAARFMQLCEAFDLPLLFLCDTPGIMVGPEAEKSGTVRKSARMFVAGANLTVPTFTIILRKAYGLGAELMFGGAPSVPQFTVSWPTGEMGGMGFEGQVKLSHRNELAAIEDLTERRRRFEEMVAELYHQGHAINVATYGEIDDVIDPAESRAWIMTAIRTHDGPRFGAKRVPFIDTW